MEIKPGIELKLITPMEELQKSTSFASPGDEISVWYTGVIKDSRVQFDSNVGGTPFKFKIGEGQVIKCWDDAMQGAPKGVELVLRCGPEVAYGDTGSGDIIKGGDTLEFEIEVVDIFPAPTEAPVPTEAPPEEEAVDAKSKSGPTTAWAKAQRTVP